MPKKKINSKNCTLLHWSVYKGIFKSYFVLNNKFYELLITEDLEDYDFLGNYVIGEDVKHFDNIISNLINAFYSDIKEITLEELLNNDDKIMLSTQMFKTRLQPYLRDEKIKTIINGN
jgi:hypothetical protein